MPSSSSSFASSFASSASASSSASSSAASDRSDVEERRLYKVHFDSDGFIEQMNDFCKRKCCRMECNKRALSARAIERQAELLESLHTGPPSERRRHLRAHMQSLFLLTWARDCRDKPRKEHGSTYRTLTVKSKLCRNAWLALHDTSLRTWVRWVSTMENFDPTPAAHGLTGRHADLANAFKGADREKVRSFILNIAEAEGFAVPFRCRDDNGRAHFSFESVSDQPTYLPPKYTKRGLYRAYLRSQAGDVCTSWTGFRSVLNEVKSVAVSKRQRGLCDSCFIYRDSMRTLKLQSKIDDTARDYSAHLTNADAMLQQYRASKATAKTEWVKDTPRCVVLAFDYARQLGVPHLGDETTEGFWASKKALDVNLFGIVNEGGGKHGLGTPYLLPERVKAGSDTVCSMLNHYIHNNLKVLQARDLHLWSDSCTGQNKNNIVVAYMLLLVHNGIYEVVDWRFFAVRHSKFDPDRLFGAIRSTLHKQTVLTSPELKDAIDRISGLQEAVLFNGGEVRDWHGATVVFKAVPNIRKTFYYRLCVRRVMDNVVLETYDAPDATPVRHALLKDGKTPPVLEDLATMPFLPAPPLSLKRREDLEKTVVGYIKKTGRGSASVLEFWHGVIGDTSAEAQAQGAAAGEQAVEVREEDDDVDEINVCTPPRRSTAWTDTTPSPRTGDGVVAAVAIADCVGKPTPTEHANTTVALPEQEQGSSAIAKEMRSKRRALLTKMRMNKRAKKSAQLE